jgi:hypothetical protein
MTMSEGGFVYSPRKNNAEMASTPPLTDFMMFRRLASSMNDPAELIFDPKLHVRLNLDHIIRDDLERFPEEPGRE